MIPLALSKSRKKTGQLIESLLFFDPEPSRTGPALTGYEDINLKASYPVEYTAKVRGAPVLHRRTAFTDMVAAPNGAPVTIYGTDVNGPIKIGGVTMPNTEILNQVVYDITATGHERTLYKTTAWIEGMPEGHTTIQAGNSPVLPFYVNGGRVLTATTYAEMGTHAKDPLPGDVVLLKGFTVDFNTESFINGGNSILWMREDEHDGTPTMPVAMVGYPGDEATFLMSGGYQVGKKNIFQLNNTGWVIANLNFDCDWGVIAAYGDHRIVGNRVTGLKVFGGAGTGSITVYGEKVGGVILGNIVNGGRSGTRFDHAIYISGCVNERGWDCEWNYLHDNDFGRGPMMVMNSQPPRCGTGSLNKAIASHCALDNTIDTTTYRSRAFGVAATGWEPGNTIVDPGLPIVAYNNFINPGYQRLEGSQTDAEGPAILISEGGVIFVLNKMTQAHVGVALGNVTLQANGDTPMWQGALVADNEIDVNRGEYVRYSLPAGAELRVLESGNIETGTPSVSPT